MFFCCIRSQLRHAARGLSWPAECGVLVPQPHPLLCLARQILNLWTIRDVFKIQHLSHVYVSSPGVWSIFTLLCYHLPSSPELFSSCKTETLYPLKNFSFPLLPVLGHHHPTFQLCELANTIFVLRTSSSSLQRSKQRSKRTNTGVRGVTPGGRSLTLLLSLGCSFSVSCRWGTSTSAVLLPLTPGCRASWLLQD